MSQPIADMGHPDQMPEQPQAANRQRTLMVVALAVLAGLLLGGSALLFLGGGEDATAQSAPVPRGTPTATPSATASQSPKATKALISNRDPFRPLVASPKPTKTPDPEPSSKAPTSKGPTKPTSATPAASTEARPAKATANSAATTPSPSPSPATTAGTSDPGIPAATTAASDPVDDPAATVQPTPSRSAAADPALSSAPAAGNTLLVTDIAGDRSSATVTVNGTKYKVKPGESFAGFYQMYEVFNDNCAGFLYGDSNAVACVGEPIPL